MNIKEIKSKLVLHPPHLKVVCYDFNLEESVEITSAFGSYRGYYAEPSIRTDSDFYKLNWQELLISTEGLLTVGQVLKSIESLTSGVIFTGYKGGDYTYDESNSLYLAPYSSCGKVVIDVVEKDGLIVLCCSEY